MAYVESFDATSAHRGVETLVVGFPRLWSKISIFERSISTQFLIVSGVVLCLFMAVLGQWVTQQVKHSVLTTSGAQASEFMRGFLEPFVQELEPDGSLTPENQAALDELFIGTPLGRTVVSIKIWREDGLVLYATTKDLIGQKFVSTDVAQAAQGNFVAEYEDLISQESAYEQTLPMHLIEVYGPLYAEGTDKVMAVGEIYENADALAAELFQSQVTTWLVVGAFTLFMIGVLYLIVRRGAATIAEQRTELGNRYKQANTLATQNAALREAAELSRLKASEANEQFLAHIGSDIHDGPIQVLTLSTLRLSSAIDDPPGGSRDALEDEVDEALHSTQVALTELRNISTGLSMPELDKLGLGETIQLAIDRHKYLSGDDVACTVSPLPTGVPEALKICIFRVIQEGLNNASKHAPGAHKEVAVHADRDRITVEVVDDGPGIMPSQNALKSRAQLGLSGMRNRVEALSGQLTVVSEMGQGTRVLATLPLDLRKPPD